MQCATRYVHAAALCIADWQYYIKARPGLYVEEASCLISGISASSIKESMCLDPGYVCLILILL